MAETSAATVTVPVTTHRLPEALPPLADTAADQIDQIRDVLERWHDETHPGSFRFCYERPCREIAGITRGPLL